MSLDKFGKMSQNHEISQIYLYIIRLV